MNKIMLINISLISIVFGLLFLMFLLYKYDFKEENYLSITGTVDSIKKLKSITIINFKPDSLPVVSFTNVSFKKGDKVRLQGSLKNYKGKLEFVMR